MEYAIRCIEEDHRLGRTVDLAGSNPYPDQKSVRNLTNRLMQLIFPDGAQDIRQTAQTLQDHLEPLCVGAQDICTAFFRQIPALRAVVQTDVEAAFTGDPAAASREEIIYCYPGLYALTVYRLAHGLHLLNVPLLPRMMTEYAHSRTGIDIHPGATVGQYCFIDHGTGIVIGETTVIGNHVKMYQGVTLGGLSTRGGQALQGQKRHPTIEDGVTIYANATILGGGTVIGQGSIIGANAFLTASVPPHTTVTGNFQNRQIKASPAPADE